MANRRDDPDFERLWQDFHRSVNMSGHELRTWLLTRASGETAFRSDPDPQLPAPGRSVVDLLTKRKVDLTDTEVEEMADVTQQINDLLAEPPPEGPQNTNWRHALMDRGHDPLRESAV